MTEDQRKILEALDKIDHFDGSPGFACFATLMKSTALPRAVVRRICRHLARKGLAEYASGLWNEAGEMRGAGYAITKAGIACLISCDRLREE